MRTIGLVFIWLVMTGMSILKCTNIGDTKEFITVYAMLSLYLGWLALCYIKKRKKEIIMK